MTTEPADPPRPSHATAPNQFVTANGVRYAYRRFGAETGTPVVFLQHFRGGMDNWDPAVTDGLAANRPVILFNNTGVASSSGQTPGTVEAQADDAAAFIRALGLTHVDVLGFSIGGYVAQALPFRSPPRSEAHNDSAGSMTREPPVSQALEYRTRSEMIFGWPGPVGRFRHEPPCLVRRPPRWAGCGQMVSCISLP